VWEPGRVAWVEEDRLMVDQTRTAYTTCPLCEATCGLELTIAAGRIIKVRGDAEDVLSHGFICPKGASFGELDADPDRLRTPRIRRDGKLVPASWDEAFEAVDGGLTRIIAEHGRDAVALYLGNPNVHTLAGNLYAGMLRKALGSRNIYTASTLDQMPKHVSCGYMFGSPFTIPVPDIDRADFLLVLGADPYSSNGSLWTVPDAPGRLKALQERGGRFVVVDPRRSRTARAADRHVPIRPGTDVFLLLGMVNHLFGADLTKLGRLADHVNGLDELKTLVAPFTPAAVAPRCGVDAATIRELARELAQAEHAAVYGRIGTSTVAYGTVTSWLIDVLNVLTGNLDREGGAMFPLPAHSRRGKGTGPGFTTGRWHSRVRGLPEVLGEFPAVTLADEISTPGEGQVRALVTVAGNPASSVPNAERLSQAIETLEFMVSVDPYVNETSRHADVILPPPPPSRGAHYDFAFYQFAVRNVANFSPAALPLKEALPLDEALPLKEALPLDEAVPPDEAMRDECEILLRLMAIFAGLGWNADVDAWQDGQLSNTLEQNGLTLDRLTGETAAERMIDLRLRSGAYGDGFGRNPDGLSLRKLLDSPHGVDLGPLAPRIPEVLRTSSGRIELCPPLIAAEVRGLVDAPALEPGEFVLVGRRHLRSNNSWMHNVPALVKGRELCTVVVNRGDAARLGLTDGGKARVASRAGRAELTVEVSDDIAPGVVSIPHGWGHNLPGVEMSVAAATAGINVNQLIDDLRVDPLSGTAVLNGVPVAIEPVAIEPGRAG
jgi:anaerobic selenocysteine-containing dehydrogenase